MISDILCGKMTNHGKRHCLIGQIHKSYTCNTVTKIRNHWTKLLKKKKKSNCQKAKSFDKKAKQNQSIKTIPIVTN